MKEKEIYIPHINYTVRLCDISRAEGLDKQLLNKYIALTRADGSSSTIYFRFPIEVRDLPLLCHEIMHVIEYISVDYGIVIQEEKEHVAYLFQYILKELMRE